MISKLKKIFSFLSLVLLGLLSPIHFASAGWVADLALWIPSRLILLIVWLAVKLAVLIVGLAGSLLNWVLSPNFISLSYTRPGDAPPDNPIIKAGLGVTQGFVNMLLVLVLVYIAIATILRLAGYETKKLLVTFIIVALLVNFSPVLCGLIVDASNIIMNFFVQDLRVDTFGQTMGAKVSQILGGGGFEWTGLKLEGIFGVIFQLCIMVGFLLVLTFILLTFAVIFILRYLVIWVLVILSPLAFVCYILPVTKKYFDQWWQQFLAWSFIGVTCGFFLYLGLLMVTLVPTAIPAPTTGQGGLFDSVLPFFVSVVFLGLGIVFGLQTSAMGATSAINIAKAKGKAAVRGGWKATKFTGAATAGAIRGIKEGKGVKGRIGGALKGAGTYEGREKGREVFGKILEKAHMVRPGAYETARRKRWRIEEETKRLETLPTDRLREITQRVGVTPADIKGRVAAFEVLAKRSALSDKEKNILPKMQSLGADTKQVLKARPDWAPLLKDEKGVPLKISKVVAGASTRDFTKNTQTEALKNIDVLISLDTPKIQNIGLHGSAEQKRALREAVTPTSTTGAELKKLGPQLKQTNLKEFNRIRDILTEIIRNPNLQQ